MQKLSLNRGFTLIELAISVFIIAVLTVTVGVVYNGIQASARDTSVLSDLDKLDAIQTFYGVKNNVPGKAWFSGNGVDPDLAFIPSEGNVIDVVIDDVDYCIRGYNPDGTINSIMNAAIKESTPGACGRITNTLIAGQGGTLPAPTGIAAQGYSGPARITISWNLVPGVSSYNLQYATDSNFSSPVSLNGITGSTRTINGLIAGQMYYLRISSVLSGTVSSPSSVVSVAATSDYGSLAAGTSIEGYWTSAPEGFLIENGASISRTQYPDLFAAIGYSYGGSGDNFNLPDSRGRASVNLNLSDPEFDVIGERTGSKTETITSTQMPSHTHVQNAHNHTQDAHTHTVNDPGHNHTQNAHSHTYCASVNCDFIGMQGGGQGGWSQQQASINNIFQLIFTSTTATNNASLTGVSINSVAAVNQTTAATNQNTGGGGSHNNIQPSIVKNYAIKYSTPDPLATTLPEGTSINGYWTSAPSGYLFEDGAAVSRTTYASLFAVIGTTYGAGNGSTTFNLPDSRGRLSVNRNPSDAEFNTIGEEYGEKAHTVTIAELPSHTHTQNSHTHTQNSHTNALTDPSHNHTQNPHIHEARNSPNGDFVGSCCGGQGGWGFQIGSSNNNIYRIVPSNTTATNNAAYTSVGIYSATATNQSTTATNQNTGGDGSHNEIQPSIVRRSAIKVTPITTSGTTLASGTSIGGYWSSAPSGYLLEDGAAVSRTTYAALFAAIGTTYGAGDGSTTFNLPDSRGRTSVNRSSDTEFDTLGEKYGTKAETLTIAQMPSHTHTQNSHTHTQDAHTHGVYDPGHNHTQNAHNHESRNSPNGDYVGMTGSSGGGWGITNQNNNNIYRLILNATTATNNASFTGLYLSATTATNQSTTATNQNTGGGGAHNNIQPSIVKLFAIKI
mgnify:CR=1 FL=1